MQISLWIEEEDFADFTKIISRLEKDELVESGEYFPDYSLSSRDYPVAILIAYDTYIKLTDFY